jgi:hypothetical protein
MVNGDGLTRCRARILTRPWRNPDSRYPHVSEELICKYLTDLKLIGALEK